MAGTVISEQNVGYFESVDGRSLGHCFTLASIAMNVWVGWQNKLGRSFDLVLFILYFLGT